MIDLRIATKEDGAAIAAIYAHYVENTAITFEYVAPDAEEFGKRITHKLEKYPFIVAEADKKIVGYAYADTFRERAAFGWCAELSVYVDRNETGKGIGQRLYAALVDILRLQGVCSVVAAITVPNEKSIALHEKMGFRCVGEMKRVGFKLGTWHDMAWYEKQIKCTDPPLAVIPFGELDGEKINEILE